MKWITVVLLLLFLGCERPEIPEPVINKIFVSHCHKGFLNKACSDFHIGVADVIERKGTVWRINIEGEKLWMDSERTEWKPFDGPAEDVTPVWINDISSYASGVSVSR